MATNGNHTQQIVNKAWSYAHVLRDEGLSYMAYTEQITFLLFLKMADEQTRPPYSRPPIVPPELDWQSLLSRDGDELEVHYRHVLEELGRQPGMLGEIFRKARPPICFRTLSRQRQLTQTAASSDTSGESPRPVEAPWNAA